MPDPSLSEQLSRQFSVLQLDQVPANVIAAAKLHILDSLGCLLAGSRLEPGKLAYNLAVATSGASANHSSTLFGANLKVSTLDGVQAMATAAHCGELDDIHGGAATCIGAMV
ncbi:MAG: MmgE/PrpD family protein, partial [Candidatus Binatia bacterium]